MRRIGALIAAVLACGGSAAAGGPQPVLAVEWRERGQTSLLWVDPLTLRAVPGGRLVTGDAAWPHARSPGGRYLLSGSASATDVRLRVVDLSQKRASPVLVVSGANGLHAVWPARDRLVAVTFLNGRAVERLVVAPHPLRILRRTPLSGKILSASKAGARLVLLLGPDEGMGQLRVAVVGADSVRTLELEGMQGGTEQRGDGADYVHRVASPALVVDPSGRRSAVVGPLRYADIDLVRLIATTRVFPERRLQKRMDGWWRSAAWVGGNRIAVTGSDYGETSPSPAGLLLVDLRDGQVRALDSTSSEVDVFGRTLIGWGRAVNAYELDGTLRYGIDASSEVMAGPTFLYLNDSRDRTSFRVVDPADGRVLGRARTTHPIWVVQGV